jgi:oligoendopeptidase F
MLIPLLLAGVTAAVALSQAQAPQRIDLAKHFFASPAAEIADRHKLEAGLTALQRYRGKAAMSAKGLLAALRLNDLILASYGKHDAYLLLRCRMNRADKQACTADDALGSEVTRKTAFLASEIRRTPPATIRKYIDVVPELAAYRFFVATIRRDRPHTLPEETEEALAGLDPQIAGWQYDLYDALVARAAYGMVQTSHGTLDVRRQRNLIAVDRDPRVREEGFRKRYAALIPDRDLIAFALIHVAQAGNKVAALRGFAGAPDRKYFSLHIDPVAARALIQKVCADGILYKRFLRIRTEDVQSAAGPQGAGPWDMDITTSAVPMWSLPQARVLFHDAFAGLGADYQAEFDALLAPANGRADIVPGGGPDRSTGGFSVGYEGNTGALFVGNYDGTYKDLSVIVHEGGHAVHRQLMSENHVLPNYTDGPHFLFESFAEFNELLLADYLATHAQDAGAKRYYKERFLAVKGLDFLLGADDAAVEQAVYDGVKDGSISTADDLDALTARIDGQFWIWPNAPEMKARWESLSLAFEDPLYSVNYMYASMLALRYFQLYEQKPGWFAPRYIALLRNGLDDTPENLLRRFLDIDFDGDALLANAVSVVDTRLKALEREPRNAAVE